MKSFYDSILNKFYLEKIIELYISKETFNFDNIFISPIYAPDHIIKKYPKVLIMTGIKDPILS